MILDNILQTLLQMIQVIKATLILMEGTLSFESLQKFIKYSKNKYGDFR